MDDMDLEIERMRILGNYLNSLPKDQRTAALALQYQLELKRETMTEEDFIDYIAQQIDLNIRKMESLLSRLDQSTPENVIYLDDRRQARV